MSIPDTYAEQLYVVESADKGRSLYTKTLITPGTIIAADTLYLSSIDESHVSQYCSTCYTLIERKLCCSMCKQKYYCSIECQRKQWRSYHWLECYCIRQIPPPNDSQCHSSMVLLLLQLILEQIQRHSIEDIQITDELQSFTQLCSHVDSINDQAQSQYDLIDYSDMVNIVYSMITALLTAIKQSKQGERNKQLSPTMREKLMNFDEEFIESSLIDKSKLLYDLNRLHCNVWTMYTSNDLQAYGYGLSLLFALINHSCVPNTVLQFNGSTVTLRAIATIQPNTELSYTYIDLINNTENRRYKLQSQYSFLCKCIRCETSETPAGQLIEYQLNNYICANTTSTHDRQCTGYLVETADPMQLQCTSCKQYQSYSAVRKLSSEATLLHDQSSEAYEHNDIKQAITLIKLAIKYMIQCVSQYNITLHKMSNELGNYLNIQESYVELLPVLLSQLYCKQLCLSHTPNHIQLGLQYTTIGDIAFELQYKQLAIQYYTLARDILKVTHGVEHQLYKDVSLKLTGWNTATAGISNNNKIDTTNIATCLKYVLH